MWKVLVLCVIWGVCKAQDSNSWQISLDNISRNLHWDMSYLRDTEPVNYSEPVINTTYKATSEFDMRAMGPLYNSTRLIIDVITNKQAYPEGWVSVSDGHVEVGEAREHWRPLLAHYAGPAAVLLVAALFTLLLPFSGLVWCCCVWCGRGRRRRPFDRKYDGCLKGFLAILLIALLTLFLFGVVCAFATESQWEEGATRAPAAMRTAAGDVAEFLNASQAHARWLLVNNYRELEKNLNFILDNSGVLAGVRLSEFSRAVSVSTLQQMVQQLGGVVADLRVVGNLTADLKARAIQLHDTLRGVKTQLVHTLNNCTQPECRKLKDKNKINQLQTTIQYNYMPDVPGLLRNVSALTEGNLSSEVAAGQRALADLQRDIRAAVATDVPRVKDAIAQTGEQLAALADELGWAAGNASASIARFAASAAAPVERVHHQYGPYRRYVGLGTAIGLLLITFLIAWGLMCGVCGKRPDAYGASDCCNKGAGASCLLCGMVVMFIVGGAVSLVLAAYFAVGVASQRFICDPITEPRGNRLFEDVDRFVDLEKAVFNERRDPDYNLTAVLVRCHTNLTIFETLHLHRLYNLDDLQSRMSRELTARAASLTPHVPARPLVILRPQARFELQRLKDTGLSDFNFDKILDALETNMTSLPLDELSRRLANVSSSLAARRGYETVAADLDKARARLDAAHSDIVLPMREITAQLTSLAVRLRDGLRFNHSSLNAAITDLMEETTLAEQLLNVQGPLLIRNMTQQILEEMELRLQEYLERVTTAVRHDVGRCGPVSRALNATRDAACTNLLMPTNGYWIALAWCLVLFIPSLVVSRRLARLYRHVDPYPGPLVEAEYLYDAYADRDNVPLANAYKAEKRAGRARSGAGGGGGSAAPATAGPAPLAEPHARRYNDMAPKHWEEGPPRYHGPTEYERPPPYYYPGPNDRQ